MTAGDPRPRSPSPRSRDAGMVTAETAAVLPVVVLLTTMAVGAIGLASARIRVTDAAHVAALALARGDRGTADRLVRSSGPAAALTVRSSTPGQLHVTVTRVVRIGPLPGIPVTATAVAPVEPTSAP